MPRICLLLLSAVLVWALDDFERAEAGINGLGVAQVALVPAPAGGGSGSALSLAWPERHGRWIECVYAKPRPVADLAPGAPVVLRAALWLGPASGVRSCSVRLLDARNEVWQWTAPLRPTAEGGWSRLALPLSLEQANGHWAGDNDGVAQAPLRLLGFSVAFADEHVPAGTLLLDDLAVEPLLVAGLATGRFPNLLDAGGRCDLRLGNRQERELTVEVRMASTDWSGLRRQDSARVVLPPHGETALPLPVGPRAGLHRVEWTLQVDGLAITGHGTVAVTAPVPAGGRDGFRFGICSHSESRPAAEQERELRALAAAGASVVRCGTYWSGLEPKPGAWRWEGQDRLVDLAAGLGLETQPILGFTAGHAASAAAQAATAEAYRRRDPEAWKLSALSPPDDAAWRRYVAALATRYRGRIRMYEVWNEPDIGFWRGSTEDYLRILRSAAEEIRRADPQAEVLTGGFATALEHAGRARNPDLQARVLAEASDAFDVHAFHGHGPFEEFVRGLAVLDGWRARMAVQRPLYCNETALSAYGGGIAAERTQACELVKKLSWAVARGALGYTWYELRDGGTRPDDPEHHYGLLDSTLQPKPAFCAYAETVRRLRGARPLGRLDLGAGRYGLVFAQPQRRVVVLWHEDPRAPGAPVLLRVGGGLTQVCDLMGEASPLPLLDGVALLQPSAEPVFVELPPGDAMPEVLPPLLRLAGPSEAGPGQPYAATVVAGNPLVRPADLRLSWSGDRGTAAGQGLVVPPGGNGEVRVATLCPRTPEPAIEVAWNLAGTPWSGTLRLPLRHAVTIPATAPDDRDPDFVIGSGPDVVSFCRADPQLAAQVWRGPDDLSARVWLARRADALVIRVDVRDDVHRQREDAAGQWRGDGVQFALQVPGAGLWELGMAQHDDGAVMRTAWVAAVAADWQATAVAVPDGVRYEAVLPCAAFGLTEAVLGQGLRFNLIVNDNDGPLREGFVRIAPGIGESKDPGAFPIVRFAGRP